MTSVHTQPLTLKSGTGGTTIQPLQASERSTGTVANRAVDGAVHDFSTQPTTDIGTQGKWRTAWATAGIRTQHRNGADRAGEPDVHDSIHTQPLTMMLTELKALAAASGGAQ
ncbi:hypothetical protein [Mycetocola zhujimingii]|uniref:hypothetical protein n=1 Tax=Mycetocola zhujimingii TaxID=2079792 RepID=UPI0013C52392|nr:hypothetical protein [Mycetocola zhujimingii]